MEVQVCLIPFGENIKEGSDTMKKELTKEEISQILIALNSWKKTNWFAGEEGNKRIESAINKLQNKLEDK